MTSYHPQSSYPSSYVPPPPLSHHSDPRTTAQYGCPSKCVLPCSPTCPTLPLLCRPPRTLQLNPQPGSHKKAPTRAFVPYTLSSFHKRQEADPTEHSVATTPPSSRARTRNGSRCVPLLSPSSQGLILRSSATSLSCALPSFRSAEKLTGVDPARNKGDLVRTSLSPPLHSKLTNAVPNLSSARSLSSLLPLTSYAEWSVPIVGPVQPEAPRGGPPRGYGGQAPMEVGAVPAGRGYDVGYGGQSGKV